MRRNLYLTLLFCISILSLSAQKTIRIVDAQTNQPLAFVNVRFDQSKKGCSTDINGKFELPDDLETVRCTYVGYKDTLVRVKHLLRRYPYVIRMQSTQYALREVVIVPGINPAHRIIRHTIENRKHNDPEKLASFRYKAYHKMVFTADSQSVALPDSLSQIRTDSVHPDSVEKELRDFFDEQHLFMMESVSERKFKKPDRSTEKVLGTRVSGMQAPMFAMLATQFQSFSFYKPLVQIAGMDYVNPISKGSPNKYFFRIEDTLYDVADTVFIIAFRPLWGKNFKGLKGVLYIHSAQWAIQSVIAEPFGGPGNMGIRIEQLYQPIDSAWFPVQLNTRLTFKTVSLNRSALVGIGHTYLGEIEINPDIRSREFNHVVVQMYPDAPFQKDDFWNTYREDSLDNKEKQTYRVIDSLGEELHTDRYYKAFQILSTGQIPIGFISLDLDKFYQVNMYEKSRWGLGVRTNDRLIPWMVVRGYGAYGVGDKKWKYGGGLDFMFNTYYDFGMSMEGRSDVVESARQGSFGKSGYLSKDFYRNVLIRKMVGLDQLRAKLHFRALKHFRWEFGASYAQYFNTDDYIYNRSVGDVRIGQSDFTDATAHVALRFGFREKFVAQSMGLVSLGTKYPVLNVKYTKGFNGMYGSDFDYDRWDMQLDYTLKTRYMGKTELRFTAGKVSTSLPWYLLYNGRGSYAKFFLDAPFTFNTMRMNEFLSDAYTAVYLRQNFGTLLWKTEHFAPELSFVSSAMIGRLDHADQHRNISYKTLEKGFYESGLIIDKLFSSNISSIGIGVYYRYGEHAFDDQKKNFVFRLTSGFNF